MQLYQVKDLLTEEDLTRFEVYKNYLYIKASGTSLIRFSLTEGKAEAFVSDFSEFVLCGNSLYYIDHAEKTFSIFKQDLETGESVLFRGNGISKLKLEDSPSEDRYDNVICINNRLFYTMRAPGKVYRAEESGADTVVAEFPSATNTDYLTISANENSLYYLVESGQLEGHLFAYNAIDGHKTELAAPNNIYSELGFKVIADYVFFYDANASLTFKSLH